ncbi:iron reductase [Cristinia sonorae]|uniref:ferric-chelate reductase (NADPH) n=1 Tax=Cristinia sonorae TaxID=1940300 RepID=A0A8K0UEZ6_9AGAR|nr:iron reductase [Cristinia sonorae]
MHMHMYHHARSLHARSFNSVNATALLPRLIVETPFDHAKFVYHLNLFIVVVVVLFILCAIPRLFYRFSHPDEWRNGHFLRSKPVPGGINVAFSAPLSDDEKEKATVSPLKPAYFSPTSLPVQQPRVMTLDEHITTSINLYDETDDRVIGGKYNTDLSRNISTTSTMNLLSRNASTATTASTRVRRRREGLPAHMPSLSSRIPFTLRPGMDVGKALVLICYFGILLYGTFHKSNVFSNAVRTGFLAVSQIPVVVVLGTKNNFIGMLLGMGYERLNVFHRYAGLLLVLACNVHTLGYFYEWALEGTVAKHMAEPVNARATVGLVCIDILAFFSTSFWRNRFYNVFLVTHVIAVLGLLSSICMHSSAAAPYVWMAIAIYIVDRIIRGLKTRYTTARLTPITDLGMTRVELPAINDGWRAGQHVRLQVLSKGMGRMGWAEVHPFTIASISQAEDGSGLVLMCKKTGSWTRKLFDLAKKSTSELVKTNSQEVKVLVEGPYGGPGHTMFCSFSGAMFVCGGSGITFALSAIQDLVEKDLVGESRVKTIDLVWTIPDPTLLRPLLPLFSDLLTTRTYADLCIHVHYTRAGFDPTVLKSGPLTSLPPNLTLNAGRPKLASVLSGVLERATALNFQGKGTAGWKKSQGVVVGVCGPLSLGDEVRSVVRGVERRTLKAAGGIEIHEEVFGW